MGNVDLRGVECLEVAVNVGCPNRCPPFCPQEVLKARYKSSVKSLSFAMFKQMLVTVPSSVLIDFAGLTEPYSNPEFMCMVRYARAKGHEVCVITTNVGASVENVREQGKLDLYLYVLHLPDGVHFKRPFDASYWSAVATTFECIRRNLTVMTMNDDFVSNNRENMARGHSIICHKRVARCYKRVNPQLMVFPDGTTTVCCMDMRLDYVLGNLFKDGYAELVRRFRNRQPYALCLSCYYNEDAGIIYQTFRSLFHHAKKYLKKNR
jgi:hypothetical protein